MSLPSMAASSTSISRPSSFTRTKKLTSRLCWNVKDVLHGLNALVSDDDIPEMDAWWRQRSMNGATNILEVPRFRRLHYPQYAIDELWRQTKERDAYVQCGVGLAPMFACPVLQVQQASPLAEQFGTGNDGFRFASRHGCSGRLPDALSMNIDGDGCMLMNFQELALTLACEKLPVKILLLNNQHLGMVGSVGKIASMKGIGHTPIWADRSPGSSWVPGMNTLRRDLSELCADRQRLWWSKRVRCGVRRSFRQHCAKCWLTRPQSPRCADTHIRNMFCP